MTVKTLKPRQPITGIQVTATNQSDILAFLRSHSTPRDMLDFERKAAAKPDWCFTVGSWVVFCNGDLLRFSSAEFDRRFEVDQLTTK